MCFSAGASFGAGIVLSAIGIVALKKTKSPALYAFAAIPLLFGMQQLTEGVVWLSANHTISGGWKPAATLAFLLFAQVIWPFWVPFSFWLFERGPRHRKALLSLLVLGSALAVYHGYCLAVYPVSAEISEHHIAYSLDFPSFGGGISSIVYLLTTIVPPLLSSQKKMHLLGWVILFSFIVTIAFYKLYIISVWCFFAAVISGVVLFLLNRQQAEREPDNGQH